MNNAELSLRELKGDNLNIKMFLSVKVAIAGIPPLGDGKSHPLSDYYSSLSEAQIDYPMATSLTDQVAAMILQTGIDTAYALGGGIGGKGGSLRVPEGIWLVHNITLRPMVFLIGSGFGCTTLKMPDGKNTWMFKSDGFDTLFPTIAAHTDPVAPGPTAPPDLTMGIWGFGLESLSLDGNKASNSSGDGLSIYGYNFCLRRVMIHDFAGTGLTTGWSNSADFPRWTSSLETHIEHCKIHDNGNDGWRMNGPHDSTVTEVQCYLNVGKNFWLGRNGDSNFARLHCYGATATTAAQFDEESSLSQCVFESASGVQLQMNAGLNGDCVIFSVPTGSTYANSIGLAIGDATHTPVNNVRLTAFIFNCQRGLLNTTYAAGGGGNKLTLMGFNSSGTPLVFSNGTTTGTYATALAQLIDYDFDLWVNGSGLGGIHMRNYRGVMQNDITLQGPDSGRAIAAFFQGKSAISATNPLFIIQRNGSVPTSFQISGTTDGVTFTNFIEADIQSVLVRLMGTWFDTATAKGKLLVGLNSTTMTQLAAPADGDFFRGRTAQAAGVHWEAPPITVPDGGTGQTTFTAGNVLLGNGAAAIQSVAGINPTRTFVISLNITTQTIQYLDWASAQQSATYVSAITNNTQANTFTNGVLTA